ncbi:thioesterase family protein [Sporichthya brevicatena]|uniref:Thioesterase family protein n=1 Tax=Sporichthya brevicatena TaxID=171442 RepID=A0ABP3RYL2_9ACTN
MADAFYEPLGDETYRSTEHTVGPWGPDSQHAGPPSALLGRALERMETSWPGTLTRISLDILGAVPVADLQVRTQVLRPGRNVELVQGELVAGDRAVLRAQAWRMRTAAIDLPPVPEGGPVDPVPEFSEEDGPFFEWGGGYLRAMQWRAVPGTRRGVGQAAVWARMRFPLVAGEEPTGLQRVLALADSGNGVSHRLEPDEWLFINTDLTVHLVAPPAGEWICLDAVTRLDNSGFGLASSRLYDRDRLVALGAQSLFVAPRS